MKPENIKKVWQYYRENIMLNHIWRPERIKEAVQKNIDGDFSPAQFYDALHSKIHLEIQKYIIYLLDQEEKEMSDTQPIQQLASDTIEPHPSKNIKLTNSPIVTILSIVTIFATATAPVIFIDKEWQPPNISPGERFRFR